MDADYDTMNQHTNYTADQVTTKRGHIMTDDGRYYLAFDGDYDYWHEIKSRKGDKLRLSYPLGRYSYDYCFRSDLPACIDKLNAILTRGDV